MSKRRLVVTIIIFVLVILAVVGISYLVSLLLKDSNKKPILNDPVARISFTKVMHDL